MNQAQPNDPILEALPVIPVKIKTKRHFEIDTTGQVWHVPTQVGGGNIDWTNFDTTPEMLAVIKGFVAFKLDTEAEATAYGNAKSLGQVDWNLLTNPWGSQGAINQANVIAAQADLKKRFPEPGIYYATAVKGLYIWAASMGVPGFSREEAFLLSKMKSTRKPSLEARMRVAPGGPTSKAVKHRQVYDDVTSTAIEAALLLAVRDLRARKAKPGITLSGVVMGYLALDFGARPASFAKLRESHFEVRETDGAICYWIGIPDSKGRNQRAYIYKQRWKKLSATWGGLIGDLIAQNRTKREQVGLDNSLDWPLFPIIFAGPENRYHKKRAANAHPDPVMIYHRSAACLNTDLKKVFKAMAVKDSNGKILVPSFYSFRQTKDSNLAAMGTPLEARAHELGQTTIRSTPRYDKRGKEFSAMLDQPMLREKLEAMARPFLEGVTFSDAHDAGVAVPFINPDTGIWEGSPGTCGCPGSPCGLSGSIECYLCGNFHAIAEGPHTKILNFMLDRRLRMKMEGKPESQFTRYDVHIFVVEEVLRRIADMPQEPE